jgi:hypothetical protein
MGEVKRRCGLQIAEMATIQEHFERNTFYFVFGNQLFYFRKSAANLGDHS